MCACKAPGHLGLGILVTGFLLGTSTLFAPDVRGAECPADGKRGCARRDGHDARCAVDK